MAAAGPAAAPVAGMTPPPPPLAGPPVVAQPVARKTSPIVWILVALLGLFVLGCVGVVGAGWFVMHKARQAGLDPDLWRRNPGIAMGKLLAATNPDVELVRTNDNDGTFTLRDRRTGKETTITFDQARSGKFTIHTEDDNGKKADVEFGGSAGKPPSWVPEYPGSHPAYSIRGSAEGGEEGGNFTFTTDDGPSKVMSFYQDKIRDAGMETKMTTNTAEGGMLVASREGEDRTLTVVVAGKTGETTVNVTYARKR